MITPELISYVREQISQGQNSESIKTTLLNQKWSEADINEVLSQVGINQSTQLPRSNIQTTTPVTTDGTNERLGTKSLVVILLLIFLYPIGLVCMYLLTKWKWWAKLLITLPLILMFFIFVLSILSINPQEALDKAAKLKAECANLCSKDINYDTCYNQCLSNRK